MSKDLVPTPSAALPPEYADILAALKERVRFAQYAALKAVNTELVGMYWDIGRTLVERQTDTSWGKSVVQQLAVDLQHGAARRGHGAAHAQQVPVLQVRYAAGQLVQPGCRR